MQDMRPATREDKRKFYKVVKKKLNKFYEVHGMKFKCFSVEGYRMKVVLEDKFKILYLENMLVGDDMYFNYLDVPEIVRKEWLRWEDAVDILCEKMGDNEVFIDRRDETVLLFNRGESLESVLIEDDLKVMRCKT